MTRSSQTERLDKLIRKIEDETIWVRAAKANGKMIINLDTVVEHLKLMKELAAIVREDLGSG